VTDTPPDVARRYRELLLRRSGEERLKMGCSMHAAARRLVLASVLDREPDASPAARRRALFERFYGHEFDGAARERILAALERGPDTGARRRVPIDRDALELALKMPLDEGRSYLDVRTGEIRRAEELTEEEADAGLADGILVAVEPLPSSVEYDWMAEFADAVSDARLRRALQDALGGRRPFRRFEDVLAGRPGERARWFAFHDARLRDFVREWLADNGIEPAPGPPRRA
jgi:hypothetical protein